MSLTKDDLLAIRAIIKEEIEVALEPIMQQVAAGFMEVHARIDKLQLQVDVMKLDIAELKETILRIERTQLEQAEQVDRHDIAIGHVRKTLRSV
jgi:hypothetical protein